MSHGPSLLQVNKHYKKSRTVGYYIHKKPGCSAEVPRSKRTAHLNLCDHEAYLKCLVGLSSSKKKVYTKVESPAGRKGTEMRRYPWFKNLQKDLEANGKLEVEQ